MENNDVKRDPRHYAKFIVAVLGAGATAALTMVGPDTELFMWLTVVSAMLTSAGVFFVPNRSLHDGQNENLTDSGDTLYGKSVGW